MTLLSGELLIPLEKCKMETSLRSYRTSLGQVLGCPGRSWLGARGMPTALCFSSGTEDKPSFALTS